MIELSKQLNDGRYVFDKNGVIFCVTEIQVKEMLEKINEFERTKRMDTKGDDNGN